MKQIKKHFKKYILYKDGKIWFTKNAEKKFFFVMTVIMLSLGVAYAVAGL